MYLKHLQHFKDFESAYRNDAIFEAQVSLVREYLHNCHPTGGLLSCSLENQTLLVFSSLNEESVMIT